MSTKHYKSFRLFSHQTLSSLNTILSAYGRGEEFSLDLSTAVSRYTFLRMDRRSLIFL